MLDGYKKEEASKLSLHEEGSLEQGKHKIPNLKNLPCFVLQQNVKYVNNPNPNPLTQSSDEAREAIETTFSFPNP